jgi:predicted P-loop ATPase
VVIWPDADAKHHKDGSGLLAKEHQPGIKAAMKIAELLTRKHGGRVRILDVGEPGTRADGWDVADAIAVGWTADQVLAFVRERQRSSSAPPGSVQTPTDPRDGWRGRMIRDGKGRVIDCRENVYVLLREHPELRDLVGLDQFSNRIVKRRPPPWGLEGEWTSVDDLQLGLWSAREAGIVVRATQSLADGVQLAAVEAPFHPVCEWLRSLRWDGTPRLDHWLGDLLGVAASEYTRLVGRYFLVQMVARVFRPGCKADCSLILEGPQGLGKSSVVSVLGGEWSSDTPFVPGDKDSFQALSGVWVYEISELDSFNRAETTRVKAFISSAVDRYRAPYERRPAAHPRQCSFVSTTNQHEYLQDSTGNRRFWPVAVGDIDLDGLAAAREQLFAEAVEYFDRGERWFPARDEQRAHFEPEQAARETQHPWEATVREFVDKSSASGPLSRVTMPELLYDALKFEPSRISHSNTEAKRIGAIMSRLGWKRARESTGARAWFYERPREQQVEGVGANAPF